MGPSDDALLDALELGSIGTPMVAGMTWRLELPGLFVRDSTIASQRANQVARARLDAADATATIARVRAHFGARPFGWNVGPRSTPVDLETRLADAGLTKFRESAGLVLRDLATPIDAPPFELVRATIDDVDALATICITTFGHEPTEARRLMELSFAGPGIEVWLARERGEILGFGQSHVTPDGILLLVGAATLPHARHRGIYRALLGHRIARAHAAGARAAIIQANVDTSAPICHKAGFTELCWLHHWIARPST